MTSGSVFFMQSSVRIVCEMGKMMEERLLINQ